MGVFDKMFGGKAKEDVPGRPSGTVKAWRPAGEWGVIKVECGKCGDVGNVRGIPDSAYTKGLAVQCGKCRHVNQVPASVFN